MKNGELRKYSELKGKIAPDSPQLVINGFLLKLSRVQAILWNVKFGVFSSASFFERLINHQHDVVNVIRRLLVDKERPLENSDTAIIGEFRVESAPFLCLNLEEGMSCHCLQFSKQPVGGHFLQRPSFGYSRRLQ